MNVIINPGSRITGEPQGWTNTHAQAVVEAQTWEQRMRSEGFTDFTVEDEGVECEGRWTFVFTHTVTGKSVELETHGIDDLKAYEKQCIFTPRVYWNGSSCGEPRLEDFAADGFVPVMTYRETP
jgi:hypothetical protein